MSVPSITFPVAYDDIPARVGELSAPDTHARVADHGHHRQQAALVEGRRSIGVAR